MIYVVIQTFLIVDYSPLMASDGLSGPLVHLGWDKIV